MVITINNKPDEPVHQLFLFCSNLFGYCLDIKETIIIIIIRVRQQEEEQGKYCKHI